MQRRAILLSAILTIGLAAEAGAEFTLSLTPSAAQEAGTQKFNYRYTLSNPAENALDGDPDLIFSLSIGLAPTADLGEILSPDGWVSSYTPGDPLIEWSSDFGAEIGPGGSLTFGFASPLGPGDRDFTALVDRVAGILLFSGSTPAPTSASGVEAPEPWGATSLILGVLGMAALSSRRRGPGRDDMETPH